jgi:hypothetical protein
MSTFFTLTRDGRQFEASCARTLGWLGDELGGMSERLLVSADRDVLQQQVDHHEVMYHILAFNFFSVVAETKLLHLRYGWISSARVHCAVIINLSSLSVSMLMQFGLVMTRFCTL